MSKGHLSAGRNAPPGAAHMALALLRRGKALAGVSAGGGDDGLDLFSRTRRGYLISSSGESEIVMNRMEKVPVGLAKAGRGVTEEFFSVEIGKHDYDWLLTPPGTPIFSSVDSTDPQPPKSSHRSCSNLRSATLSKTSKLSLAHSENSSQGPRIAGSNSTTRTTISTSSRTPSSILNTSTASVNSRPTTPSNRARTPATTDPRSVASRSTTPARTRPNAFAPTAEKPKEPTIQTIRPSTPTTRAHLHRSSMSNSDPNFMQRPSTLTCRPPPHATNSRPSSPARIRTPALPIIPSDLLLDAPPNLRTKLPERAVSTGRQRPGTEQTMRGDSNTESAGSRVSSSRRVSSPVSARGRFADRQVRGRVSGNRDGLKLTENQKPVMPDKKPLNPALGGEIGGYGRTMSKISLNMALKHMDIRQGMNGMRGVSLFPHSIRSAPAAATFKDRPASRAGPPANCIREYQKYKNEPLCKHNNDSLSKSEDIPPSKVEAMDKKIYGCSRYDAMLLKEDARRLNRLHSVDGKPDEGCIIDRRFEPLPEPFIFI